MHIILAPHIDDELIGCYTLLEKGIIDKVVYFYDVDSIRKEEALNLAKYFNLEVDFSGLSFEPEEGDTIYIPCKQDVHVHHKIVNNKYRYFPNVQFYSIDKNFNQEPLSCAEVENKTALLDRFFPSQKHLWKYDKRYCLFEIILESDNRSFIYCTDSFEGIHYWGKADNYLVHPHRHIFHVRLELEVFHDDRELEFIKIKKELHTFLENSYGGKVFKKSCEMIGNEVKNYFERKYCREIRVSVSEDNENGAFIF